MRLSAEELPRLTQKFADSLGEELAALLSDELVSDVLINADGSVYVERVGERMARAPFVMSAARRSTLIRTAAAVGGGGREGWPIQETRIPGSGWRFEGVLPPAVPAPALSIRKPARHVYPLASYVEAGRMAPSFFDALCAAVKERANILVVGGTGSGKTTLANALLRDVAETCPDDRVLVLEDTPELQVMCANSVAMTATHDVSMLDLLKAAMRLRPDRIVVGEVRGAEVIAMLSAWNTGHPGGLCTVHANDARGGLLRLEQLCAQAGVAHARLEIAAAVQSVVCIERRLGQRRVREMLRVRGLDARGEFVCEPVEPSQA